MKILNTVQSIHNSFFMPRKKEREKKKALNDFKPIVAGYPVLQAPRRKTKEKSERVLDVSVCASNH